MFEAGLRRDLEAAIRIDDVLATGGTAPAARRLVERLGATPLGCTVLIELTFPGPRDRLGDWRVASVVQYHSQVAADPLRPGTIPGKLKSANPLPL